MTFEDLCIELELSANDRDLAWAMLMVMRGLRLITNASENRGTTRCNARSRSGRTRSRA